MSKNTPGFWRLGLGFGLALSLLAALVVASIFVGTLPIAWTDVLTALANPSSQVYEHIVVNDLRLPRTLIGLCIGAALAVAGSAMQAVTRNPLADPSILGVNTGAAFAVVVAIYVLHIRNASAFLWFGFAGGMGAAVIVYALASFGKGRTSPSRLALSGIVVSSLLHSWMTAILMVDQQSLDVIRFWLAGSLAGRDIGVLWSVLPFLATGICGLLLVSSRLNVLSLGEDNAKVLGMRTAPFSVAVGVLTVFCAGSAVAVAGPIGFVGLAVPHIVRGLVGADYRWIMPYSVILGPCVLLAADILGRVVVMPLELQAGIVTALLGAPFLIVLARRQKAVAV